MLVRWTDARGDPEARQGQRGGENADRPEVTQRLPRAPLDDQPADRGPQATGKVLHRGVDRHEAAAAAGLDARRDQ